MFLKRRDFFKAALTSAGVAALTGCSGAVPDRAIAPDPTPLRKWARSNEQSTITINHQPLDQLLSRYIRKRSDGLNLFAYGEVSTTEQADLADYIRELASVDVAGLNRASQYAYWINLYNTLTIRVVLQSYIVKSIADIDLGPGLLIRGPWKKPLISIQGQPISLDDIDRRILRGFFTDPRLHYGLCRAALGSPDLSPFAMTARNVDSALDQAATRFINHGRAVAIDQRRNLTLSSIYHWYKADFGGFDGVIAHLRLYAEPGLRKQLAGRFNSVNYRFDWALNDGSGFSS